MEVLKMILVTLQMTAVLTKKKHYASSSDEESIENLLYYKDCKHKKETTTTPAPQMLREEIKPLCPCPRMCCSMCCECDSPQQTSVISRQLQPLQSLMSNDGPMLRSPMQMMSHPPMPHQPPMSVQPQIQRASKKKRMKPNINVANLPPLGGRRDFGFTRENIKNLISQDEEIKKILKDLVRVTMHKVDLVEAVKLSKNANERTTAAPTHLSDEDYVE